MKSSSQCNNDTIEDDPSDVIINVLEQVSSAAEEFISDPPIAESNPDFPDLQEGKEEHWFQRFSIIVLLPIFYGTTSSIINLYYFVELERRYSVENGIIGLMLALSYASRVLFSSLGRVIPKTSAFAGSVLTLVGYYMMLLSVHRDMVKDSLQYVHSNGTHSLSLFVLGTTLTQCNEAMCSAMQMFIHLIYGTNVPIASARLKSNYHTIKVSRVISLLTGGILYHLYSIDGVAALAAIMVILQILNLVAFYVVDIYRIPNHMRQNEQSYTPNFIPSLNISAVRSRRRIFKTDMSKLHRFLGTYYTADIPSSILQKIIPISVYGRTISVICIWSSVAIKMDHDFAFNFIAIGSMMACATLIDWIASIVFLRNDMHLYFKEVFPSPRDLFYSLSGMAFSCALMVIPLFITFVIGFFLFCIFNAILKIMLLDMQGNGGIVATDGILFTTFRRVSVGISLVCIPMLFELQSSLPMVLGLSYVLLTLFALILCLFRSNKVVSNNNNEDDAVCHNAMEEIEKHRSIVKKSRMQLNRCNQPQRNLQYDEQLMVASMIRGKDF
jgi:hypothetical protein